MAGNNNQQAENIMIVNAEIMKNVTINHNHLTPSTSGTHAPRRNPINNIELAVNTFTGRVKELNDIMQRFHEYPVVVIAAMGGMGKTQLARKFASVNADVYTDRYWINAETEEQLLKSFDRLAEIVKVKANSDIDTVRDTYRSFTEGAALLIFDNVEHVNNVNRYLPTRIQLKDITLHVLVTSRWTDWTSDLSVNCYQLQPLDISVSLQLFQRKFGQTCIETMQMEWEKLTGMLGYLPLALQVASSYIYKRNKHNPDLPMVLAEYMKQLEEGADELLKVPLIEYGNRSVYTSMLLTLQQLENKAENVPNVQNEVQWKFAVTLINVVAYMNPDYIEKRYLLILLDNDKNLRKLDEALAILTEYSLFNQSVDWKGYAYYTVHRIIQTSIRYNQTVKGTADKYYIRVLKYAFAENYFPWNVSQYINQRASAVAEYYKNNPSLRILKYLLNNKAITAMEAVLKLSNKQIQIEIKEHDLLYLAVDSEDLSMTELLCKYGADINQICREVGEPPLHRALRWGTMEIATWLLKNGAAPAVRDWKGRNALHEAARGARATAVSLILQQNKDLNIKNENGETALHVLVNGINFQLKFLRQEDRKQLFARMKETARVLIMNGLSLDTKDNKGCTPLDTVKREVKDILLEVAEECNIQLLVHPMNRKELSDCCAVL